MNGAIFPVCPQGTESSLPDRLLEVLGPGAVAEVSPVIVCLDVALTVQDFHPRRASADERQRDELVYSDRMRPAPDGESYLKVPASGRTLDEWLALSDTPNETRVRSIVVPLEPRDRAPFSANGPARKDSPSDQPYPVVGMAKQFWCTGPYSVDVGSEAAIGRAGTIDHASLLGKGSGSPSPERCPPLPGSLMPGVNLIWAMYLTFMTTRSSSSSS